MTSIMEGPRVQTSSKQWPENLLANVTFHFGNKSKYEIPLKRGNGLKANLLAELGPNCVNPQLWKGIGLTEK